MDICNIKSGYNEKLTKISKFIIENLGEFIKETIDEYKTP